MTSRMSENAFETICFHFPLLSLKASKPCKIRNFVKLFSSMSSIIFSSLFLFSVSLASTLSGRVNQIEHVVVNCLAYVSLPDNTFGPWDTRSVSATFSDGDTFTSSLATTSLGSYAGPGSNAYGGFNCFYRPITNLYIDGSTHLSH